MREHSGTDEKHNNVGDPTLKEREGQGGPGRRTGDFTEGASFEVAADHDQPGGQRSPSARGRGETPDRDATLSSGTE